MTTLLLNVHNRLFGPDGQHLVGTKKTSLARKQRNVAHVQLGLGGNAEAVGIVQAMSPETAETNAVFDTAGSAQVGLRNVHNQVYLTAHGCMAGILDHKESYPLLRAEALPECIEAYQTYAGGGMVRLTTMVLYTFNENEVKDVVRRVIERALEELDGPLPKKLIVHTFFSPAGSTGSTLAILVPPLVRDTIAVLNWTGCLEIIGHMVSPAFYLSLLSTPAERLHAMANSDQTYRELYLGQQPKNLAQLAEAMQIGKLRAPGYDAICIYDVTTDHNILQQRDEVLERIAANVHSSHSQALVLHEDERDVNPAAAQRGEKCDEAGTAVLVSAATTILQLPTTKLARSAGAHAVGRQLDRALIPPDERRTQTLAAAALPVLELEQTRRNATAALQPDGFCLPSTRGLKNHEVVQLLQEKERNWNNRGRRNLESRMAGQERQLLPTAVKNTEALVQHIAKDTPQVLQMRSAIEVVLEAVERREGEITKELERLAAVNAHGAYRQALSDLQNGNYGWLGARSAREAARRAWDRVVENESMEAAHHVYRDHFLWPIRDRLADIVQTAGTTEAILTTLRQQLALQRKQFDAAIGFKTRYFIEAVLPSEIPTLIPRLVAEVESKFGTFPDLQLTDLLKSRGEKALLELLEGSSLAVEQSVAAYLEQVTCDIHGFIKQFRLAFDLEEFLTSQAHVNLPCKLNLTVYGPANTPLKGYVVAGESLRDTCMKAIQRSGSPIPFEFVADDPYTVMIRAKRARAPFSTMPGLAEVERHGDAFRSRAKGEATVWDHLESTGLIADAAGEIQISPNTGTKAATEKPAQPS